MSAPVNDVPAAVTEGEKPVRERLSKATIEAEAKAAGEAAMSEDVLAETGATSTGLENGSKATQGISDRGRPTRKRSFDETEEDGNSGAQRSASARLPRKRSRETPAEADSARVSGEHVRDAINGNGNGTSTLDEIKHPAQTTPPKDEVAQSELSGLGSPKTKRSKLEENKTNGTETTEEVDVPTSASAVDKAAAAEQEKKAEHPQGQVSFIIDQLMNLD